MKKLIFLTLFTSLLVTVASAQNFNSELNILQVDQNQGMENGLNLQGPNLIGIFANNPFLAGMQGLIVEANQIARITMKGNSNTATLTQAGMGNIGIINIQGGSNSTNLLQDGYGLLSILNIRGNQNMLDVEQTGNALQNYIEITGSGLAFDIQQSENGITMRQSGPNAMPLEIKRTGRSIPIIIKNN